MEYRHYDTHYYIGKNVRVLIENHKEPQVTVTFGSQDLVFNKVNAKELLKILSEASVAEQLNPVKEV